MKFQSTLKALRKSNHITARFLFNLFYVSITSRMAESVCNIVLFLIAAEYSICKREMAL